MDSEKSYSLSEGDGVVIRTLSDESFSYHSRKKDAPWGFDKDVIFTKVN